MSLFLLNWMLKNIRQGHCRICGCEIWNMFDVNKCYNCGINEKKGK